MRRIWIFYRNKLPKKTKNKAKKESNVKRSAKLEALCKDLEAEKAKRAQVEQELVRVRKEKDALEASLDQRQQSEAPISDDGSIGFDHALGPTSTQRAQASIPLNDVEGSRFMSSVNQLSVSSINIPECKPLDGDDEIYRYSYEAWRELLEDTMRLAGVQDDATKFTIFKIKAGPRLLQIFRNTKSQPDYPNSEIEPFENAMHRLKTYFGSGSDVMLQRRKLSLMTQNSGESSLAFITRVGATARLCEYGEEKELEEIVGTIAEHAVSKEVRIAALKMLSRKGTFSNLVDTVRELEAIRINEEFFKQKHQKMESAAVAAVTAAYPVYDRPTFSRPGSRGGRYQHISSRRRDSRFNPSRGSRPFVNDAPNRRGPVSEFSSNRPDRCWRCNSIYHLASECNAVDKVCMGCGRIGHILRACRSSSQPRVFKRQPEQDSKTPEGKPETIATVEKVEDQTEVSEAVEN